MDTVISLPASSMSTEQLRVVLAAYLDLDRARVFRRLFVARFGVLAMVSLIITVLVPGFSAIARMLPPALFLTPPALAWIVELRFARRLDRYLHAAEASRPQREKVVKSS